VPQPVRKRLKGKKKNLFNFKKLYPALVAGPLGNALEPTAVPGSPPRGDSAGIF